MDRSPPIVEGFLAAKNAVAYLMIFVFSIKNHGVGYGRANL